MDEVMEDPEWAEYKKNEKTRALIHRLETEVKELNCLVAYKNEQIKQLKNEVEQPKS